VYDFGRNISLNNKYFFEKSPYTNPDLIEQSLRVDAIRHIFKKINDISELLDSVPTDISKIPQEDMDTEYLKQTIDGIHRKVKMFLRVFLAEPSIEIFRF
jgi:hypothetical protein